MWGGSLGLRLLCHCSAALPAPCLSRPRSGPVGSRHRTVPCRRGGRPAVLSLHVACKRVKETCQRSRLFGGQAGVSHFYKGFPCCPQVAWCGCPPHHPLATSALSQPESSEGSSGAETVTSCPNRTGSSQHCSWLCDSLGAGSRGTATPTGTSLRWWWRWGAPLGADGVSWGAAPRTVCQEGERCAGPEVSVVAAGASGGL